MKKLLMSLLAGFMLLGVQFAGGTSTATASPVITLDYGESCVWLVDKGSCIAMGKIGHTQLAVTAQYADQYAVQKTRKYYFTQQNGTWVYRYEEWRMKEKKRDYPTWKRVSGDQLANDILYSITN